MNGAIRNEVIAAYTAYLAAFRANDIDAINRLVSYPLAYIDAGTTTLVDSFPIKPAELIAEKRWHGSRDIAYEVVFTSDQSIHPVTTGLTRTFRRRSSVRRSGALGASSTAEVPRAVALGDLISVPAHPPATPWDRRRSSSR